MDDRPSKRMALAAAAGKAVPPFCEALWGRARELGRGRATQSGQNAWFCVLSLRKSPLNSGSAKPHQTRSAP